MFYNISQYPKQIILLLAIIITSVTSVSSNSYSALSPWLDKKGYGIWISSINFEDNHKLGKIKNTELNDDYKYKKLLFSNYLEYSLSDKIAIGANIGLSYIYKPNTQVGTKYIDYTQIFTKYQIVRHDYTALAVALLIDIPIANKVFKHPIINYDSNFTQFILSYGLSFVHNKNISSFIILSPSLVQFNNHNRKDIVLELDYGVKITDKNMIIFSGSYRHNNTPQKYLSYRSDFVNSSSYKLNLSYTYNLTKTLSISTKLIHQSFKDYNSNNIELGLWKRF